MSRIVIDTSAYSHFKRGDPEVVDIIDSAEWVGVPAIVLGELWAGFAIGARRSDNERAGHDFMVHPVVHEMVVNGVVAREYANLVVALRAAGTPIPANDIWIAATAASANATVLTYDAHFKKVENVSSIVLGER